MTTSGMTGTRNVRAVCGALLVALLSGWTSFAAGQGQAVQQDAKVLQEFNKRIQAYVDLHKRIAGSLPPAPKSADAAVLVKHQQNLAEKLRAARASAVRGDIFIPEVQTIYRTMIKEELSGPSAAETRDVILGEGNPKSPGSAAIVLKVNEPYPSAAPLSTVPPFLLLRLPKLPEQLDYRFVGRALILRDTSANMIIDFLPDAVSPK